MSERKTVTVDAWLVQYAADRSSGVRPCGDICASRQDAEDFAKRIAEYPWVSCVSITPLKQTIPAVPQHDTSDAAILGWMATGDLARSH